MIYIQASDTYFLTARGKEELIKTYKLETLELKLVSKEEDIIEILNDENKVDNTFFLSYLLPEQISPKFLNAFELIKAPKKFNIITAQQQRLGYTDMTHILEEYHCSVEEPSLTLDEYIISPNSFTFKQIKQDFINADMRRFVGLQSFSLFLAGAPGMGKTYLSTCGAGTLKRSILTLNLSFYMNEPNPLEKLGSFFKWFKSIKSEQYVLLIDEIDKMIVDDPKSKQVTGFLLTELSGLTKKTNAIIIATANNITFLATNYPELFRKGRFDALVYISTPERDQAEQLFQNYIDSFNRIFRTVNMPALFDCYCLDNSIQFMNIHNEIENTKFIQILERLHNIELLKIIKEEYKRMLEEDRLAKQAEIFQQMGKETPVFETDIYAKGSFFKVAMKNEDIKKEIETLMEDFRFTLDVNKFVSVSFALYREKLASRERFPYSSAEIAGIVKDIYNSYYTTDIDVSSSDYIQNYLSNMIPTSVALREGIAKMEAVAGNFKII